MLFAIRKLGYHHYYGIILGHSRMADVGTQFPRIQGLIYICNKHMRSLDLMKTKGILIRYFS